MYTFEDWYDGPRGGYAEYRQKPHYYRSLYFDNDVYNPDEDRFELTPVSQQVIQWVLARHALWQKWDKAYQAGTLPEEPDGSVRVLTEDLPRYHKLCALIENDSQKHAVPTSVVRGDFTSGPMQVQWYDLDNAGAGRTSPKPSPSEGEGAGQREDKPAAFYAVIPAAQDAADSSF